MMLCEGKRLPWVVVTDAPTDVAEGRIGQGKT